MPKSSTSWPPGRSGNPKGRPKKARALTELLERHGGTRILEGDRKVTKKEIFSRHVWDALARGCIRFDEDDDSQRVMRLEASEWVALTKFVLSQIDGAPPPVEADTEDGNQVAGIEIVEVRLTRNPV